MSRVIKFRAWDAVHKQFDPTVAANLLLQLHEPSEEIDEEYGTRFFLSQYTGLKDENGKEIYEGDIVADFYGDGHGGKTDRIHSKDVVEYGTYDIGVNGFEYSMVVVGPYVKDECLYGCFVEERVTVIGNIYENPELIDEPTT